MKTSDILQQKATIDGWEADKELLALNQKISVIKNDIDLIKVAELHGELSVVEDSINDIIHDMNALQSNLEQLRKRTNDIMQAMSQGPLAESYERYEERKFWFNKESAQQVRELDQFKEFDEYKYRFNNLITKCVSWKFPTLYIRPNSTHFIDALKASDILFVMEQCDVTDWLEANIEENFYKKGIRFKLIDEAKRSFIQHIYPAEQMGLIVMENFLNFKPLEIIKQYLKESERLMRPGGHLLFTYNNCDLPSGARNFENGLYCFTPGRMLKLMCEAMGFEVVDDTVSDRINWLLLRKPGELTTLKGGKCLGQIMDEE